MAFLKPLTGPCRSVRSERGSI